MEIPPEVRYVLRNEKSIAFQQFGSGTGRLVQINPLAGNLDLLWTDAVSSDQLVRGAQLSQIVMFDQLGQGLSDPVEHVRTIEERVGDLAAVMDAAGFESAVISAIFDASLVALVFAAQYPERVDGLVLWNPFAQGWRAAPFEELVGWDSADEVKAYDQAWQGAYEQWGQGATLKMQMPALATRRNVVLWGLLERAVASRGMIQALHQVTVNADVREVLPLVQARALVLRTHGHRMPEGVMRSVADLLPNADYRELPATDDVAEFFRDYRDQVEQFMFGASSGGSSDRALVTVMFTDIVGSTEHLGSLGDARWREVLTAHERMVRREVETTGGRVLEFIGDGSLSTFDGPARAIRSAERICAAAGKLNLEIRAGLHTGECEVSGDSVAGMAVHIAARISALAAGGEVLVSRTVRDLVTGSGIELQTRGEHKLKGLPESWELFAVGGTTQPLPAPDPRRALRPGDRIALLAAHHTPGLLRGLSRITSGRALKS